MKISIIKNKFGELIVYLGDHRVHGRKPIGNETKVADIIVSSDIVVEQLKKDCIECNGTGKKLIHNMIVTCDSCKGVVRDDLQRI